MTNTPPESITTIDGHYFYPGRAAAYLLEDAGEAAFVDNNTVFSVPYLLDALTARKLSPEQVKYIIVTHIHLDHSGGTAELLKHCPNATVVCHPRAQRHLADPSRLIAGVKHIYGEEAFAELYGEIEPIAEDRLLVREDDTTLTVGQRELRFHHALGHAKHHFFIHDSATNSILAGDVFGTAYRKLQEGKASFSTYVAAPPEFDPPEAIKGIKHVVSLKPERVYVAHFGMVNAIEHSAEQLIRTVEAFHDIARRGAQSDLEGEGLQDFCQSENIAVLEKELAHSGLDPSDSDVMQWATAEVFLNKQGLAHLAEMIRAGKAS